MRHYRAATALDSESFPGKLEDHRALGSSFTRQRVTKVKKSDPEEAFAKAIEYREQGNFEASECYFTNALAQSPGKLSFIRGYVETIQRTARIVDAAEGVQRLQWLESFLRERVSHVATDDVPMILELVKTIVADRKLLSPELPTVLDEEEQLLAKKLRTWKEGQANDSVPERLQDIDAGLADLDHLRQYAVSVGESGDSSAVGKLDQTIGRFRTAQQFELLLEEASGLLDRATRQEDSLACSYHLQMSETAIRQLVLLTDRVEGNTRHDKVDKLLARFRSENEALARRESEAVWAAFNAETNVEQQKARLWNEPNSKPFSPSGSDQEALECVCQQQLDRIRAIAERLQTNLPKLVHEDRSKQAMALLAELNTLAAAASVAQQQRYNVWALGCIQACLHEGHKYISFTDHLGISTFNDEKALGKVMVEKFGPVDIRLLTTEVQRCYHEVFEHLFAKLKSPSKDDDFQIEGSKLTVLNQMFNSKKKELSDF